MSQPAVPPAPSAQRRASYGPTSPTVGERGARTRERIVEETLSLFTTIGFHETTVRDIAAAAEVSRATLYQYFESKDDIFVDLLNECGGALLGIMRRTGHLGPTIEGYQNLRQWLADWTAVYEKYGTLFVQWANVDVPGAAVRPLVLNFLHAYNLRIANRLRRSGLTGMDVREAAIVATSVVHRFNYLRFASPLPQPPPYEAVKDVATVLQTILFPTTPHDILRGGARPVKPKRRVRRGELSRRDTTARAAEKLDHLTRRSAATVERIMRAGAECFAESGYHRANVDDIVKRAGFARGTFYKYFSEKLDLLLVLSDDCEDKLYDLIVAFTDIPPGAEGAAARRAWLEDYLDFRDLYIGVVRTWVDRAPSEPSLEAARARVRKLVNESLEILVSSAPLAGIVSVRAAEIMFTGVLERLPDAMIEDDRRVQRGQIVELIATVMERGLFGLDLAGAYR